MFFSVVYLPLLLVPHVIFTVLPVDIHCETPVLRIHHLVVFAIVCVVPVCQLGHGGEPKSITTVVANQFFCSGFSPIVPNGLLRAMTAFEANTPSVNPRYSAIVSFVRSKLAASFAVP